ncbi:MAG TPA: adenosylcobalamin-dependent ribonucleoside-diphosphate reductase [Puia sp.]|uniref:adenosylcobalamin-dependent ribonucleoside-diphosphate reductase n=1 Tax=Puia sp. TaxID=2045100 RepID=UPI002C9C841D|nr:adenosylcobalamin-dependent ribonucleoside-diphosphate reductase [Puia sp.]HVU94123.1 adenosylcobalamin-dependent ribonucleoside-diphosphate reductase [Puia sp.]
MGTKLSKNALSILQARYLLKDEKGRIIESPDGLFQRVATAIARAELAWGNEADRLHWETVFFDMLSSLRFLPNSPTLMNAGTPSGQLSACFVLPVEDSIESIFSTLRDAAIIQKSGGGTGFNFSRLRPRHDLLAATGGSASGPVSFIRVFNAATEEIRQGGKRRGANMGILDVDHPDIEEFINCKRQEGALSGFNLSVGISDAFMKALQNKEDWPLRHPSTNAVVRTVPASRLWDAIADNAWRTGDPGLLFLDTINVANPTPGLGRIDATNPCGEVPLLPYEACNLGSINLVRFIRKEQNGNTIDWPDLGRTIHFAIRFLDDVIECNRHPIDAIRKRVRSNRKIGLGIMGWADLLALLDIPYDSDEALALAHRLMKFLREESYAASAALAAQRGPFPNWDKSVYAAGLPLRNATRLSIAPTGTISIIADVSSSIEPLFALAWHRQGAVEGEELEFFSAPFAEYLHQRQLRTGAPIGEAPDNGSATDLRQLPAAARRLFRTALEITPEWHLRHQAVFQQYTDNAVSKTINLPESASPQDIARIYRSAWEQRLKGITVFRHNCRSGQLLHPGPFSATEACKVCIE